MHVCFMLCDLNYYFDFNFPDEVINLDSLFKKQIFVESMHSKKLWVKCCFQKKVLGKQQDENILGLQDLQTISVIWTNQSKKALLPSCLQMLCSIWTLAR